MKKILLVQGSACIAEFFTYPIDYIKTMIQVNQTKSVIPVLKNVWKNPTVYNGLKPSLCRHCVYTTSRIIYMNIVEIILVSINL